MANTTITVSTAAELLDALETATGGETILLSGGNYGNLTLIDDKTCDLTFPATVTLAAADPDNPPTVTGLDVRNASNLAFDGITFDYSQQEGQPLWFKPFKASGCIDLAITNCTFDGDLASGMTDADNGFPTGFGLHVSGSVGVTVANNEIFGFYRGMVVSGSDDVAVTGNDLHTIRMDGMNFAAVQGVVIEDNHIHDFARSMDSADHADMIQFWTNNTTRPSTDIVIRNNLLDIGEGEYTQSIFMRNDQVDRGLAGEEMYYQNVLIEGNVIINGHAHGITVGATNGLTITQNSVLHDDGASEDGADPAVEIPRITVAGSSTNVVITANATSDIVGESGQQDWTVDGNAIVQDQDPAAPGWYGDVFLSSTLTREDGQIGFIARPGGLLDELDAGAPATHAKPPMAAFQVLAEEADSNTMVFDAASLAGDLPEGTTYLWDFGDGHSGTGSVVQYSYTTGGIYTARLTVRLPDGQESSAGAAVTVQAPDLVRLNTDGSFTVNANGETHLIDAPANAGADDDPGLQLGASGVTASIARNHLSSLLGDDNIGISFTLDADTAKTAGEVFRLHGSFIVSVDTKGELVVRAWSSEGDAATLRSSGLKINDLAEHEVDIRLEDGKLSLTIDDMLLSSARFEGTLADKGRHDLTFGNSWGATNLNGDLSAFEIDLEPGNDDDPFTGLIALSDPPLA